MNKKKWTIILGILVAALILDIGVVGAAVLKTVRRLDQDTKNNEIEEELTLTQYPVSETVCEETFMEQTFYVMESPYPGEYSQYYMSFEEENQEEERQS